MANETNLHKLTNLERQIFIFEIFAGCAYVDHAVFNQYFHFVDSTDIRLRLPSNITRMLSRDLKDLRDAGVISYTHSREHDWYESHDCNFVPDIPEDASENKKEHLKRLNLICRYLYTIADLEYKIQKEEDAQEAETDDNLYEYVTSLMISPATRPTIPCAYDKYKHTDPYIREYVNLKGETSVEELIKDFDLLEGMGYLEYDPYRRRFCSYVNVGYTRDPLFELREDFGITKDKNGRLYL